MHETNTVTKIYNSERVSRFKTPRHLEKESQVKSGIIYVQYHTIKLMTGDLLAKPLPKPSFLKQMSYLELSLHSHSEKGEYMNK